MKIKSRIQTALILLTLSSPMLAAEGSSTKAALEIAKPFGFDKLLFVKRNTYTANHYYTEYLNSKWLPGGNVCVLDLASGKVTELVPELKGGVFGRFDLDFDAKHLVLAWKSAYMKGYMLYEIAIDPATGARVGPLRQLTFPAPNEEELVKKYGDREPRKGIQYHHGTDDMDPCYLPDGDIAFISTRCHYGILCNDRDQFTTTVLYRLERSAPLEARKAGAHLTKLTNSSVSEASPTVLPDGRIMYTRWEYVDKGAVAVKCLWAMRPDGTGSSEIYGNTISNPPTLIYGRPIPNPASQYVVLGTPHCPQNGMGTVILLDMNKPIRTPEPMTYVTSDVRVHHEDSWRGPGKDKRGRPITTRTKDGTTVRLFKEPYPLSEKLFIVPMKAPGPRWADSRAYDLVFLEGTGKTSLILDDPEFSCFLPFPLRPRTRPPVVTSPIDKNLAEKGLATCMVTDIYHGMENTPRGTIKYIRILEQVPRPWTARRYWGLLKDNYDQQHAVVTKDTHLGLKVQHGVVPVEEDGSAHFTVPADKNIFFQALDENYMAVQTERTYVNYRPGEMRSCIGCHETPEETASLTHAAVRQALKRPASTPGPQPGEAKGQRLLDYVADVQTVWDKHCIKCHSGKEPKGKLDLSGTMTEFFNVSYESLLPQQGKYRVKSDRKLIPIIAENHPKMGNVHYLPARSLGSHASVLAYMLSKGKTNLRDPKQLERAKALLEKHTKVDLSREELLRVTNWIDTNAQYYGSYWGRRNLMYWHPYYRGKAGPHPDFRKKVTFEEAIGTVAPNSGGPKAKLEQFKTSGRSALTRQ